MLNFKQTGKPFIKMNEEQERIYCKEQHIPKTKTRKKFIKDFLQVRPTTYVDEEHGKIQCYSDKDRSVSDILSITRGRFKKTSLNAVVRILDEINKEGNCDMVWCTQVKKFVVRNRKIPDNKKGTLLTDYSFKYYNDIIGTDGISYKELMEIRDDILKDKENE